MEEWQEKLKRTLIILLTLKEPEEEFDLPRIEDFKPEVQRMKAIRNFRGKMRRIRKLKPEDVYALIQLREKGMNWTEIGRELGISRTAARKTYKKIKGN